MQLQQEQPTNHTNNPLNSMVTLIPGYLFRLSSFWGLFDQRFIPHVEHNLHTFPLFLWRGSVIFLFRKNKKTRLKFAFWFICLFPHFEHGIISWPRARFLFRNELTSVLPRSLPITSLIVLLLQFNSTMQAVWRKMIQCCLPAALNTRRHSNYTALTK